MDIVDEQKLFAQASELSAIIAKHKEETVCVHAQHATELAKFDQTLLNTHKGLVLSSLGELEAACIRLQRTRTAFEILQQQLQSSLNGVLQQFKEEEKREIHHVKSCLERVHTFLRREMTNVLSLILDDNTIKKAHQIRLDAEVLISGKSINQTESSNKPSADSMLADLLRVHPLAGGTHV